MNRELSGLIEDWPQYLMAAVLVMVRLSGLMVFAPIFSSPAIAPRAAFHRSSKSGTGKHAVVRADLSGIKRTVLISWRKSCSQLTCSCAFRVCLRILTDS